MSIIPTASAGGVVIRDGAGNCQPAPNVQNAYCPDAQFGSTCQIRYLPTDCSARITPAQINAFQSELISFAETLNPTGNWNCGSVRNITGAFNGWITASLPAIVQQELCQTAFASSTDDMLNYGIIICDGEGSIRQIKACDLFTDNGVVVG